MGTKDAFLRDIVEHPDDDTPRLIFADWLEEHDDPDRAEFIRVQIELAKLQPGDSRRAPLLGREARLYIPNRDKWAIREIRDGPHFHRGFIEEWCAGFPSEAKANKVFRQTPIRTVFQMMPCPDSARIRTAHLPAGHTRREVITAPIENVLKYVARPALKDLRSLNLAGNEDLGDDGLAMLVSQPSTTSPALSCLDTLNLYETGIGDAGVAGLTNSPLARSLRRLDLSCNPITPSGLGSLLNSDLGGRLEDLSLTGDHLQTLVDELVNILPRAHLQRLQITGAYEVGHAMAVFANAASWGALEALDLSGLRLNGEGLNALLSSRHLAGLTCLHLDNCGLLDADLETLARCGTLNKLSHLSLASNNFGTVGVQALAASASLRQLTHLSLRGCRGTVGPWDPTGAGLTALVESPLTATIISLDLGMPFAWDSHVSDASLKALATSPYVRQLTSLRLGRTEAATDVGAKALAESTNLPCLAYLHLGIDQLTKNGLQALLGQQGFAWIGDQTGRLKGDVSPANRHRVQFYSSYGEAFHNGNVRWYEPFFEWKDQRCFDV